LCDVATSVFGNIDKVPQFLQNKQVNLGKAAELILSLHEELVNM